MLRLVLRSAAALLLAASTGILFAQSIANPGQIATAPNAVLLPSLAPGVSSSAVDPETSILTIEERHDRKVNRIWVASMLAMGAATALDSGSSWGKREGNPLLASSDGTFGAKGLSIKTGVAVSLIASEILLRHHKDLKSKFAIGNFVEAAIFGGVAIHNISITAPK
ncbi:MAG: hypothetical protein JO210_07490 [Acidobacteriaceae bacterium]|nr:hypothetical protein [Acidobacteriaceae bacterium]